MDPHGNKPEDKDDELRGNKSPIPDLNRDTKRPAATGTGESPRRRDKSAPAEKGPGSASADTGMTSDGGYIKENGEPE